ncbi:hypothetical protein EYF80_058342 [Liparis tanakae]|uniref:Uncharacterized protein n=1 Tax=Liparis tanakae TaxID=230148 RepID=A0A4Z2ERH5_9TELE|nr:hypothetical protein EYF80_058342 [Liparis tanakae]
MYNADAPFEAIVSLQDPECLTSSSAPREQAACFMAHSLGYDALSLAHTASSARLSGQSSSHSEQRPRLMRASHRHFLPALHWMYCSGDVTSGQIRLHVTQYALFVWSTTHVELPGHKTSRHVSVETKKKKKKKFRRDTKYDKVRRGYTSRALTLALPLVLHVQVGVAFAFGLEQCAFVLVGLPV